MRYRQGDRAGVRLRGFTLVELMITIAILAILLAVAAPSFNDAMLGSRLGSLANRVVASSMLARGEAIKRNSTVTMCVSTDGATCATGGWEQGWIVLAGTAVLLRQEAAPAGLKITESATTSTLTFSSTGVGATTATLTICRLTPTVGGTERVVRVNATGRAYVEKTTNAACA